MRDSKITIAAHFGLILFTVIIHATFIQLPKYMKNASKNETCPMMWVFYVETIVSL